MTSAEALQKRNQVQGQLDAVNNSFSQTDAGRYFTERLNNFAPLSQEQRGLQTQANDVLPNDIATYTEARKANPYGSASTLNMLKSIMNKQNNIRGLANTVGDSIQYGQGRVGDIAGSALGMLNEQRRGIQSNFDAANQEYQTIQQREFQAAEAERERQFQAKQAALARSAAAASSFRPPTLNFGNTSKNIPSITGSILDTLGQNQGQALSAEELNRLFNPNSTQPQQSPTSDSFTNRIQQGLQTGYNTFNNQFINPATSSILKLFGR